MVRSILFGGRETADPYSEDSREGYVDDDGKGGGIEMCARPIRVALFQNHPIPLRRRNAGWLAERRSAFPSWLSTALENTGGKRRMTALTPLVRDSNSCTPFAAPPGETIVENRIGNTAMRNTRRTFEKDSR